jgi:hypothetical protein
MSIPLQNKEVLVTSPRSLKFHQPIASTIERAEDEDSWVLEANGEPGFPNGFGYGL